MPPVKAESATHFLRKWSSWRWLPWGWAWRPWFRRFEPCCETQRAFKWSCCMAWYLFKVSLFPFRDWFCFSENCSGHFDAGVARRMAHQSTWCFPSCILRGGETFLSLLLLLLTWLPLLQSRWSNVHFGVKTKGRSNSQYRPPPPPDGFADLPSAELVRESRCRAR